MVFISVDVEASGTVSGFFDLLSIGAVAVRRRDGRYDLGDDEYYVELKPVLGTFNPASMKVNGLDLERLRREGLPQAEAALQFARWVKGQCSGRDLPVFVGYCANFDWAYVNDFFERARVANPFGYKVLDLRTLAYGLFDCDWRRLSQTRILRYLDLEPLSDAEAHHALADARHQARMLVRMLEARAGIHRGA